MGFFLGFFLVFLGRDGGGGATGHVSRVFVDSSFFCLKQFC